MADDGELDPTSLVDVQNTSFPDEDPVDDDDIVLQRYNSQLPLAYRSKIETEGKLLLRALRVLVNAILNYAETGHSECADPTSNSSLDESAIVAEGYEHEFERDYAALEKGIARYLDLKHQFTPEDYPLFARVVIRGALSQRLDMGLRSKLARVAGRLLQKRQCLLPDGIDWRPIMDVILRVHIDCVNGGPFIGKDIRDSHCRNMVSLLAACRSFLVKDDSAEKIWGHFAEKLESSDIDVRFQELLFLSHILPTRGDVWCGWADEAMKHWKSIESSSDWDSIWMALVSRLTKHQPGIHDWTSHLPHIYERLISSFNLPLGSNAVQSAVNRRCPHYCMFMLDIRTIPCAASFIIHSLSPKYAQNWDYLERLFALIANYFHPSNGGRWSSALGNFLVNITAHLCSRVIEERKATRAGVSERVYASKTQKAVAAAEHRLTEESVERLVEMLLPVVQQGLHSKLASVALQAASSARDLAIIAPQLVIEPFLMQASEGLESVSSPHRTTAALRLLSTTSAVFLDKDFFPNGRDYLPSILILTLPGIDPNDPTKTESTLRFVAATAGRLQSIIAAEPDGNLALFLDDYIHQLLERIFALLESLEAPPKKGRNGSFPSGGSPLSYYVFSVAIENLFASLPPRTAVDAAERISRQLTGASCNNGIKFYGALVRTAAAAAASASSGSSASIFIPLLLAQILEPTTTVSDNKSVRLVSVGDDELVWRIRMLAQACRTCGHGLTEYTEKISSVVRLAMEKPARPIYKAGGRLLRGILEGLSSIQMNFGTGKGTEEDSVSDGAIYSFEWREPAPEEWKNAEDILESFTTLAENLLMVKGIDGKHSGITTDRDILFRVLRMLHAIQRGGRWVFAGALPDRYKDLDKIVDSDIPMSKADAKLALKRPIAAGLGGEREGVAAAEIATNLWTRVYTLTSKIISAVAASRPDDGALLYRCLEPIELAHEPFRRANPSRQPLHTSRTFKAVYKPIISSKRLFDSEGGVGRAMPRFVIKLRIEAHHEMRLSIAARGGMRADSLNETMISQVMDLAINDFPRVRTEARGVATRAMRFARPSVRFREIRRVINVLLKSSSSSANMVNLSKTSSIDAQTESVRANGEDSVDKNSIGENSSLMKNASEGDVFYEKIIGASAVLRSSAVAPIIMRDWQLFTSIIKALLDAMLSAERPDAAAAVGALFGKLSSLVRPLGLEPIRIVGDDFRTTCVGTITSYEEREYQRRIQIYEDLNTYMLGVLSRTDESLRESEDSTNGQRQHSSKWEAHWRSQSLVATILYIILREDRPPLPEVTKLFVNGMTSDVVTLRHISSKAIMFVLAVHARRAGERRIDRSEVDDSPLSWLKQGNKAVAQIGNVICQSQFARQVVHTLALDHDDDSDGFRRHISGNAGSAILLMNISRMVDGDACWILTGGRPWPSSWVPRSRDELSIVRIRLYEAFLRVFGMTAFKAFTPTLTELIEKLITKQEKIISGVKDEDVRVLAAELLAGICRGLDLFYCDDGHAQEKLYSLAISLLRDMSGPMGNITGGTAIRLIFTSEPFVVGSRVRASIFDWLLKNKPIVASMGDGSVAHVQARKLRYLHSSIADVDPSENHLLSRFIRETLHELTDEIGFNHEMKTVREEVARCLALTAATVPKESDKYFEEQMEVLFKRLGPAEETVGRFTSEEVEDTDSAEDERRKSRSRQGETLSRFVSITEWSGRARRFEKYIPKVLPCLFVSFDESDRERISHARMALSFTAQGRFSASTVEKIVTAAEKAAKDARWKVRSSVLAFLQIFSFVSLFTASPESLQGIRETVFLLLADTQLEVRQAAASVFVTIIRDATTEAVDEMRAKCMKTLANTTPKGRGSKRQPLDAETICKRHGAVLGLSSMVTSSPYSVPKWLPSVLVALSGCVNDPPPISTGVRKLFADFMRTHRDEWQTHKLAFTAEELDIVSELTVSPSYYA